MILDGKVLGVKGINNSDGIDGDAFAEVGLCLDKKVGQVTVRFHRTEKMEITTLIEVNGVVLIRNNLPLRRGRIDGNVTISKRV